MSSPESYPEPDQLGHLPSSDSLRARVVRAAAAALTDARTAAANAAADPDAAVHAVRKALRQLRALVDLVARTLPKRDRVDLQRGLADARRSLGPARDQRVARELLATLGPLHELTPAVDAIDATAAADRIPPETIVEDVQRAVAVAAGHVDTLTAALPDELRPRRLARGFAKTYGRARSARKRAKRSDRAVHRFRRRAKELAYQLAIVDVLPDTADWRDGLRALDDQLGPVVDHLMAKDYVRAYGGGSEGTTAVLAAVHDGLLAGKDAARRGSKAMFKPRPKALRERMTSALAASVAQADVAEHDPGDTD